MKQILLQIYYNFFIISQLSNNDDNDNDNDNNNNNIHHYWCNIGVWDTYRTIATLFLCDSNIYFDELRYSLINKLINHCWYRIDNNDNNNIYLNDKNDPSSTCIINTNINDINLNNSNNLNSLSREWEGFYNKLIESFECNSFGNELFSKIILFQQQMNYNNSFRTVIWSSIDSLGILLKNQYPSNIDNWK